MQIREAKGCTLVCPRSAPRGKVRCLTSQQSQPPLQLLTITPHKQRSPRWSSILADFLCAILADFLCVICVTVVLACLIVDIVTTCAAWLVCGSSVRVPHLWVCVHMPVQRFTYSHVLYTCFVTVCNTAPLLTPLLSPPPTCADPLQSSQSRQLLGYGVSHL